MSPNLRRYLPFMIGAFALLIILPALFRHGSSTSTTPSKEATQTRGILNLVDHSEQRFSAAHGRYTPHLADLLVGSPSLADDLTNGFVVQLDVSSDGATYYALVESSVLNLLRARHDGKVIAESCTVVKSEKGVTCPTPAGKAKTT